MQENWLGYHEDVCEFVFVFVFLYLYLHINIFVFAAADQRKAGTDDRPLSDLIIFQCFCSIGCELLLINCLFDIEIGFNRIDL